MSRNSRAVANEIANNYYIRELEIWNPFRMFGLICSFIGLAITVVCVFNKEWIVLASDWQNAVIALQLSAVILGFIGTILTIWGVLTNSLSKKIYYYHSSGEIFFVSALAVIAALIVYPSAIELERRLSKHTYGVGFWLGWGGVFFYLLAALYMCLDDVARTITKCCHPNT